MHPTANATDATPSAPRHPRGLSTLFFTEMWERFSYYGMRALLVLFMVDAVRGGLGMTDQVATAIYGLYTAGVYLAALPGGWVADRILGAQRSVWWGGIIIAAGHFVLAVPRTEAFFLGLVLVVLGTGLLKPNISAIVGELYPEGGCRRDAGFTIFYMGINLGAFIGPLVCGALGQKVSWHYGFAAAGVGMVLGLIQFHLTRRHLGEAGARPGSDKPLSSMERGGAMGGLALLGLVVILGLTGLLKINPVALAKGTTVVIVGVAVVYFTWLLFIAQMERVERQRVGVIGILFIAAALFWSGFEQAGSSFNLFADRYTDRQFGAGGADGAGGFIIPTAWFQSLAPLFVIALSPVMAGLWVALVRRNLNPSVPVKFGLGLLLLGLGFVVMAGGAKIVASGEKVWPTWLISTYLLHTFGELCLSPVGLSSVTKLAPRRLVGQMMGTWFLAASLGNLIAGIIAGEFNAEATEQMPAQYLHIVWIPMIAGGLLVLLARPIKRLMGGVE